MSHVGRSFPRGTERGAKHDYKAFGEVTCIQNTQHAITEDMKASKTLFRWFVQLVTSLWQIVLSFTCPTAESDLLELMALYTSTKIGLLA